MINLFKNINKLVIVVLGARFLVLYKTHYTKGTTPELYSSIFFCLCRS